MKKLLLHLSFLLFPFFSFAQDPPVFKDFANKIRDISSIPVDDHLNVMLINIDNENFEVVGMDQDMAVVWRTSFTGYAMGLAKFNGKIITISATEHSFMKGANNVFIGTLINPKTGEKEVEKTLFEGSPDYADYAIPLISDGEFWGLGVRQTDLKRKAYVNAIALISVKKLKEQARATQDLDIIQFDEKLNVKNSFKPAYDKSAIFLDMCTNAKGDVFVSWSVNQALTVYRYESGKKQASNPIVADLTLPVDRSDYSIRFYGSSVNRNMLFCGLYFKNDVTLWMGSFDLSTGQKKSTTEVFDRTHEKEITKAFVKPNKKIDNPDLGSLRSVQIKTFAEVDGSPFICLASAGSSNTASGMPYVDERSLILNYYDPSLTLKFQQFMPRKCIATVLLPISFCLKEHKLCIVSNESGGIASLYGFYGILDIPTGHWDNITRLSKKSLSNDSAANGATLWFANSFVVPYMSVRGILGEKLDIDLQQNSY